MGLLLRCEAVQVGVCREHKTEVSKGDHAAPAGLPMEYLERAKYRDAIGD